jgi:small-conductance mechanosensitive channel
LGSLKDLNKRLSYLFFTEQFQDKFLLLIASFCYSSAILIPLRAAYIAYGAPKHSDFAVVILAAYSLILLIVLSLFFGKEDILRLLPSRGNSLIWIKRKIDRYYYPVFLFIMGLLILSNPYIGYSNLSWFLAFAVPLSVLLIMVLFQIHFYIRKYAVFLFMKEEDDELIDKFDYAKAYYGFFVIFSFIILFFATTTVITNIWGLNYTPFDIWHVLANEWVINIDVDKKLGIIQFIIFGVFLAMGFVISSCTHKFILSKLFDILRFEPGTQNTISRILHYFIIFITILLGLYTIHLQQFIFLVGASLGIGLGFALKDVVADLVAGFFVLLERPIEIGNYIQIDNIEGTVHKIAARSTTIITSLNFSVIVPNKDLLAKTITNWGHGRFAVGFEVQVRVEHHTDPDLVKKVLFSVVQANPVVLRVPGIVVRLENFEDNGYFFLVRAFISARRVKEYREIAANLRMEILKAFKDNNIQLARPERVLSYNGPDGSVQHGPKSLEIKFDK